MLRFESCGVAVSISRQVFSLLSCSTLSGQFHTVIRSVIAATSSHNSGIFYLFSSAYIFLVLVSNV